VMFTTGPATSADADKEPHPEVNILIKSEIQQLWDRTVVHIKQAMEALYEAMHARRYQDPRDRDPDYGRNLRELEGDIEESEPSIHIHHSGRSGPPAWQSKFLVIVGAGVILSAITATATVIVTVASIRTRIESYIESNDKRMERDERLQDEDHRRLDRGGGM
jgi:hypothetical protein